MANLSKSDRPLQTSLQQQTAIIQKLKKELLTIERKYAEMKAQKSLYLPDCDRRVPVKKPKKLWAV
jgi:phage shock protein A